MGITAAHPGRHGDLLWALPTLRALVEQENTLARADLLVPPDIEGLAPLLTQQPYIHAVHVRGDWRVEDSAPRRPRLPPTAPSDVVALGYRDWPMDPLPYEVAHSCGIFAAAGAPDFLRPWIQPPARAPLGPYPRMTVQWTDRYCELKLGILSEIRRCMPGVHLDWYAAPGSRMEQAGAGGVDWWELAAVLGRTEVLLTDCSAAHVLAAAIGVPHILVVEPEADRHHEIFWPGSCTKLTPWQPRDTRLGRAIRPVLGGDGRPTFDSRAAIEALTRALEMA